MRTQTETLLVVAALLGFSAAPARGQDTAIDPRWLAYLGCWEQVGTVKSIVCVVPAAGTSTVDLLTVMKGEVSARERMAATGERLQITKGDCTGWHSAQWSPHGQRLYLRSEDTCAGGTAAGTGVIAMLDDGHWLYIQGMTIGGQTGLRVQRYREASSELLLPDDVAAALRLGISSTLQARAAASAPLAIDDVVEASRNLDGAVVEAWLVERRQRFTLDAKQLVALAEAHVSPRVIDLMVALSYPKVFAIDAASRQGERVAAAHSYGVGTAPADYFAPHDPFCSSYDFIYPYSSYDCTGFGRAYAYGYGYGWYPGGYPVTIIYTGSISGGSSRPHGRVVNGQGYAKGDDGATAQALPRPTNDSWSRPSSGSSSGSAGAAAPTSSSSSGSSGRTAQPRRP
ncbi:MAG TPA: hypothetical protein VF919_18485 [Gemmatimonadales bacterium]